MSHLLHIFVAIFTLALPETGWVVEETTWWGLPILLIVPYALAWRVRNRLLFAKYRAAAITDRVLEWSPVWLQAIAVSGLGWTKGIEAQWGFETSLLVWPGPGLLLGIVPYVVLQVIAIDARVRSDDPRRERRRDLAAFQRRMFFSALVPFVLFVAVSTVIALEEAWRIHVEEVAVYNTVFLGGLVLGFGLFAPWFLERIWSTSPLDEGPLRTLLESVAHRARFRFRKLLVWHTGGNMANAAIVGFVPFGRIVLFTDSLLTQLGPREVVAVFSHEMGHARGRHPLVFGAFALLLILGSDLLLVNLALESELIGLGIVMGLLVLWLLAFGFLSRRFELEADLASVELLGNGRALLDALDMVGGGPAARRTTWRHFGHERRKAFLEAAAAGPEAGRRLRRTLRAWKVVLIAALLGTAAAHGWTLSGSWDEDHVVADLRLGRFDRAAHRLGEGAGVDEDLARLVERGADLGAGDWGPRTLEYEALATLAAGRRGEALDLVDLAILRGHRGLGHVRGLLGALEAIEEGPDPPIAPADLAALPPAWTPLFAPETGS